MNPLFFGSACSLRLLCNVLYFAAASVITLAASQCEHLPYKKGRRAYQAHRLLKNEGNIYNKPIPACDAPLPELEVLNPYWSSLPLREVSQKDKNFVLRTVLRAGYKDHYLQYREKRLHLAAAAIVGANLEVRGMRGETAIDCALLRSASEVGVVAYQRCDMPLVEILLQHGASINPIYFTNAASAGNMPLVELFLNHGIQPSREAFRVAVRTGNIALATLLLTHGADPNTTEYAECDIPNSYRGTGNLLHSVHWYVADHATKIAIARLLIGSGASLLTRACRDHQDSLLHNACAQVDSIMIAFWRSQGLSPFLQNKFGTCLHTLVNEVVEYGINKHNTRAVLMALDALLEGLSPRAVESLIATRSNSTYDNYAGKKALASIERGLGESYDRFEKRMERMDIIKSHLQGKTSSPYVLRHRELCGTLPTSCRRIGSRYVQ